MSERHEPLKVKRAIHWEPWGRKAGKRHSSERMSLQNSGKEELQQNGLAWEPVGRNSKATLKSGCGKLREMNTYHSLLKDVKSNIVKKMQKMQ